jgi:hypothetical protein
MRQEEFPEPQVDFKPGTDSLDSFFLRVIAEAGRKGGQVYANFPHLGFKIAVTRNSNPADLLNEYQEKVEIHEANNNLK